MDLYAPKKVNLLGLSPAQMEAFFIEMGESASRGEQVLNLIHRQGTERIDDMLDIRGSLRQQLALCAEIRPPKVVSQSDSADGTRKWIIEVAQGGQVETVFIPEGKRGTLCISSQVGCSLACTFCSTGRQGFQKNLDTAEIIGQVWLALRSFDGFNTRDRLITNVVFMGMGEPLLNFNSVVATIQILLHQQGYGLSKRRVTLSTSGVVPALHRLGEHVDVALAISLHAPNDELRSQLVPLNDKYPISDVLDACLAYRDTWPNSGRKIVVEYILLSGVNDSISHAHELAERLRDFPCKINLIPFNPFPHSGYERPGRDAVDAFWKVLSNHGFIATVRRPRGDDIDAACGQLVGIVQDRTRRKERIGV